MFSFNKFVSNTFSLIGFQIGNNPKIFIVTPVIIAVILSTGFYKLNYRNDIEVFAITNGTAHHERNIINDHFPLNSSQKFTPSRLVYLGRFARLIVSGKNGVSILNRKVWEELEQLDEVIRGISIKHKENSLNYSQICATWNGVCYRNGHLELGNLMDRIENGSLTVTYPLMFNPISFETYFLDLSFGEIVLRENSTNVVDNICALQLHYFLKNDTNEHDNLGLQWENAVIDRLESMKGHWNNIDVYYEAHMTIQTEVDKNVLTSLAYMSISVTLTIIFATATSITDDWVNSKPLVALMGVVSANMGALASIGFLCFIEIDFVGMNMSIPFIALGVGMDDTFVMLAAWWKTSPEDSVPERMANCYGEAAVSITVTTLTDTLSFYVGIISTIPCINIFCVYAGTAVLFIYIWHVFFFGGILALSGYYENKKRHSLFLWREVMPSTEAAHLSKIPRWFLSNGPHDVTKLSTAKIEPSENRAMKFFKDSFAPILEKKWAKVSIILVYFLYIGISIWGISKMQEGVKTSNLVHHDSYAAQYYRAYDKYFWYYPQRLQVVITTELDYSKKETQDKIKKFIGNATQLPHIYPKYTENWLDDYLKFLDNYNEFYDFNITTEQDFIDTLREYFLNDHTHVSEDIKFNDNFTKIIATRYILQGYNGSDYPSYVEDLVDRRKLTNSFKDLNVTTFGTMDVNVEPSVTLREMAIKLIGIAAIVVMIVAILFIPSVISSIFVFLSIASVELGVLGFMVFWGINLDFVSLLTLIMCVGFSVDFPAHVCYAYISSKYDSVEDKIKDTLHSLGLPIVQGAISTIIAVTGLMVVNSYTYMVFYKIVVLIMLFSAFNALFVLPTLLLIFRPLPDENIFSKRKTYVVSSK